MEKIKNAFNILGLSQGCTVEDVKKKYRLLIKKYHPDSTIEKNISVEEKGKLFIEITEAYNLLSKHLLNGGDNYTNENKTSFHTNKNHVKTAKIAFKKGIKHLMEKDYNNAINTFELLVRQFPDNEKYMLYYIKALMNKPRMIYRAKELCMEAINKFPFNPDFLKLTGDIYLKAGLREVANRYYAKAIEMGLDEKLCPELIENEKKSLLKSLFGRGKK